MQPPCIGCNRRTANDINIRIWLLFNRNVSMNPQLLIFSLYLDFQILHVMHRKLRVSHFITIIMVNVSHVFCCFINCFLEQVEGWHLL